jgi:hypothetical protein
MYLLRTNLTLPIPHLWGCLERRHDGAPARDPAGQAIPLLDGGRGGSSAGPAGLRAGSQRGGIQLAEA